MTQNQHGLQSMIYLAERNLVTLFRELFLNDNNDEVSDPKLIANKFNDFVVNVGPNLAKKCSQETDDFYKFLKGRYNDSIFFFI